MVPLLWGSIGGVLGLIVLIISSLVGLSQPSTSFASSILFLIICPVSVVGAMVHRRRQAESLTYGQAVKAGLVTACCVSGGLLIAWLIYINLMEPDYFQTVISNAEEASKAAGEAVEITALRVGAARQVHSTPIFYLIACLVPLIAGAIASLITAIGTRKPSVASGRQPTR